MCPSKSIPVALGGLGIALVLSACAAADDAAPFPGVTSAGAGVSSEVQFDEQQLVAAMKVCHGALTLEHQLVVDFDWNYFWETAANMEIDAEPLRDEALRSAAEAVSAQVPEMLEDDDLFAGDGSAFLDAITPLLDDLFQSCDEWTAANVYGYDL